MSSSTYFDEDEQAGRTFHPSVGLIEPTVTGVGSRSFPTPQLVFGFEHDTVLPHPDSSGYQAEEEPRPVHTHAYSNHSLPLQQAEGSNSRPPSAKSERDLQVADANVPGPDISLLCASAFAVATPAPTPPTPDTVRCQQCLTLFTGTYRKGNLARHIRDQHAVVKGKKFKCTDARCDKWFTRKDALLKHARVCQPGLHSEAVKRKKNNKTNATTPRRMDNDSSTPHRRSDDGPIPTNCGSATNTQQAPTLSSITLGSRSTSASTNITYKPTVADPLLAVGNWLPKSSELYGPEAGAEHASQQIHHIALSAGAPAPPYHTVGPLFQYNQQNLAPYNTAQGENWQSHQPVYPPYTSQNNERLPSLPTGSSHHGTADMSTPPSSQGVDTTSSSYFHLANTDSISVQGPEDPMVYSPLTSPHRYGPASLHSGASPYTTSQHPSLHRDSSTGGYFHAIPRSDASIAYSHDDQLFYQQSSEFFDSQDDELGRKIWGVN